MRRRLWRITAAAGAVALLAAASAAEQGGPLWASVLVAAAGLLAMLQGVTRGGLTAAPKNKKEVRRV